MQPEGWAEWALDQWSGAIADKLTDAERTYLRNLIGPAVRHAVREEREACAQLALSAGHELVNAATDGRGSFWGIHRGIAEAIRARRSEEPPTAPAPPG